MAGKDDFFGDGSGFGESEEANLDDFFQPAVDNPEAAPEAEVPSDSYSAPIDESDEPPPPPPFPEMEEPSYSEAQPFPEAPPDRRTASVPPPPPPFRGPTSGEALFPMDRSQMEEGDTAEEEPAEAAESEDEPDLKVSKEPKPGIFSKIPKAAFVVTAAVVAAVLFGVGGYFAYGKFIASKKKPEPTLVVKVAEPSPIVPQETPAMETPGKPVKTAKPAKPAKPTATPTAVSKPAASQPAKPATTTAVAKPAASQPAKPATTTAASKPAASQPTKPVATTAASKPAASQPAKPATTTAASKPAASQPAKPAATTVAAKPAASQPAKPVATTAAAKPATVAAPKTNQYKPKPLEGMPPLKTPSTGAWIVHLERLALETSLVSDAAIVKKAGFDPFRSPENRSTSLTTFNIVGVFSSSSEAHEAAWKADGMGYRPEVNGTSVKFAACFSQGDAGKILSELSGKGIKNVKIEKSSTVKKLQALRVGPFNSETEAQQAASKLKSNGFSTAMVMQAR